MAVTPDRRLTNNEILSITPANGRSTFITTRRLLGSEAAHTPVAIFDHCPATYFICFNSLVSADTAGSNSKNNTILASVTLGNSRLILRGKTQNMARHLRKFVASRLGLSSHYYHYLKISSN